MGYMERLGLWGAGNPAFSSFVEFMDAVGSRGVCALELVAMDMKAQGMYVARTLSYAGAPARPPPCPPAASESKHCTRACMRHLSKAGGMLHGS
jgi:hypothetical protein